MRQMHKQISERLDRLDFILCRTFIRFRDEKMKTQETFFGETLLKMAEGNPNQVAEYFRLTHGDGKSDFKAQSV